MGIIGRCYSPIVNQINEKMEVDQNTTTEVPRTTKPREIPEDWKVRKIKLSDEAHEKLKVKAKASGMAPSVFLNKLIIKNF